MEVSMTKLLKKFIKDRKGQGLLEYAFLIAGIAFIALVAISVFGHKVADQYAIAAGMLPGGHTEDNLPIATTEWLETTGTTSITGTGEISWQSITGVTGTGVQENNVAAIGATAVAFVAD
jgi:pilus assembly protein Flp/PilA